MDPDGTPPAGGSPVDAEELEERQYAAVEEAKDLLNRLDEVPGLTDLVRERMEAAANLADEAAISFSQGNPQQAGEQTGETAEQFGELARQVEALVAREVSDRIAASRGIAARIAEEERALVGQLEAAAAAEPMEPSQSARSMIGRQSRRVREGSRTLEDVLKALAGVTDPDAGNAPERITEILEEQRVTETVARAQTAAESATADEPSPNTETELEDTAERFELTSNELDRLYRSLVMPRMARLRELERELAESAQGLDRQETRQDVQEYTEDLEELIRDLQDAEAGGASREELFELVENRNLPGAADWQPEELAAGAVLRAPETLRRLIPLAGEEVRRQIHELILADLQTDRESPIPPEYERLVDEYLRVLAADSEQF